MTDTRFPCSNPSSPTAVIGSTLAAAFSLSSSSFFLSRKQKASPLNKSESCSDKTEEQILRNKRDWFRRTLEIRKQIFTQKNTRSHTLKATHPLRARRNLWMFGWTQTFQKNVLRVTGKSTVRPTNWLRRTTPITQAQNTIFQTILCRPFHFSIMYIVRLQIMTLHLQKECFPSYIHIK